MARLQRVHVTTAVNFQTTRNRNQGRFQEFAKGGRRLTFLFSPLLLSLTFLSPFLPFTISAP